MQHNNITKFFLLLPCLIVTAEVEGQAAPDIYTRPPPSLKEKKPGHLEQWQIDQYFEKGYVVVPEFFSKEELQPAIDSIEELVDALAEKLYKAGKIQDKCEHAGFYRRLSLLEKQFPGTAVIFIKQGILPEGMKKVWANERLLNVVEQIIGPNIAGNPVWNLRSKTPHNVATIVPWHQDNGYLDETALHTLMPTAWIPLIDATVENGCMQVVSGGHSKGITATHTCCAGPTWYVDLAEEEIENTLGCDLKNDVVDCPVPFGGMLLINNCIPHRSLPNVSNNIRWSMDLRWQRPDLSNGFYGLKECVLMRTESDPNYIIDWEDFAAKDRTKLQAAEMGVEESEFDTTITGPWMRRWKIVNHNKHTTAMKE